MYTHHCILFGVTFHDLILGDMSSTAGGTWMPRILLANSPTLSAVSWMFLIWPAWLRGWEAGQLMICIMVQVLGTVKQDADIKYMCKCT